MLEDTLDEDEENFSVVLSNPANATLGSPSSGSVYIVDNDDPPTVSFSSSSYSVNEDAGNATLTVNLSTASGKTVTVHYASSDSSAVAGSDYTAVSSDLTFNPGQTSKTLSVPITNDDVSEGNETFGVTLSSPSNASLGSPSSATVTITNVTPSTWTISGSSPANAPNQGFYLPATGTGSFSPFTGDVSVVVPLELDASPQECGCGGSDAAGGVDFGLAPDLVYHSETVDVHPLVQTTLASDASDPVPSQIKTRLTWNGGSSQDWVTFSTSNHSAGDTYLLANQVSSAVSATGRYSWTLEVVASFTSRGDIRRTVSGSADVVARGSSSDFGQGWSLDGLDQLVSVSGGVLWVYGSGGSAFFASAGGGAFTSPADDFGTLTQSQADSTYTYTALGQVQWKFDSSGKLTAVVDPHNLAITYAYSSGRLATIAFPDGAVSTFSYDGSNKLSKVEAPGGRTTTVTVSSGDLTSIQGADGGLRTFSYSGHRLTRDQYGLLDTTYAYDSGNGTVATVTQGGNATQVSPAVERGLAGTAANASQAPGLVTDARGNLTSYGFDDRGRLTQLTAADGATTQWLRNSAGLATVTIDPLSRRTTATFATGTADLTRRDRPDGTYEEFSYHATFHKVTQQRDANGNLTTSSYDGNTSDLLTVRNALNQVTSYTWSGGLLQTVQDPRGNVTSFLYDGARRLQVQIDALGNRTTSAHDAAGNVTGVTDARGNTTQYAYDGAGRLMATTYPGGAMATALYNAAGQVTDQTDQAGTRTAYAYDARGLLLASTRGAGTALAQTTENLYDSAANLTGTRDPRSNLTQYLYDSVNRQTVTIDALGQRTTTFFDTAGQATGTRDANTNLWQYVYDSLGRSSVTIDPASQRTTTFFDSAGNVTGMRDANGNLTQYVYDALNRQTVTVDAAGNRSTSLFDAAGNLTGAVDPRGNLTQYVYDALNRASVTIDALSQRSTSLFDAAGNLTGSVDARGNLTQFLYDALNRQTVTIDALSQRSTTLFDAGGRVTGVVNARGYLTASEYDGLGRPVATVDALGGRATTLYDVAGNVTGLLDARGKLTQYLYDALNRASVTIDAGSKRTTSLFDAAGNLTGMRDARTNLTQHVYDALNRQTVTVDALGNRTTSLFDAAGNLTGVRDARSNLTQYLIDSLGRASVTIDAASGRTTSLFDAAGNLTGVQDARGYLTQYLYDALNRQTVTVDARSNRTTSLFDAASNVTGVRDARNNLTQYVYDALNRASVTIDTASQRTTSFYDAAGNLTGVRDANNNLTQYLYDALDRQTVSIDALSNRTTTLFDAAGNVTYVKDADNNVTTFGYDDLNRQVSATDPLGHTATFAYNEVGALSSATDWLGRRRDFQYDAANRLTTETWVNAGGGTADILTYTYDEVGNVLTARNSNGTYTLSYDALGRVTVVQEPFGLTLTFTYDGVGNRTVVQDSLGGVTTSTYDEVGNLTRREFGGSGQTPLRIDQTYNAVNQIETQTRYKDLAGSNKVGSTTFTYDTVSRLSTLEHRNGSGTLVATYTYNYDAGGRVTGVLDHGTTLTYTYDNADQLTADGSSTFTYDGTGNRTNTGYSTGTGNRLANTPTWTYVYDDEGNLTKESLGPQDTTWTYGYDHRNQMIWAEQRAMDGGTLLQRSEYQYDVFGNRLQKKVDTNGDGGFETTERYAYDGWKRPVDALGRAAQLVGTEGWDIWADLDGSSSLTTRYLRGDAIDQLFARLGAKSGWLLTDRLGSVRGVTDRDGVLKDTLAYDGFGNMVSESDSSWSGRYAWTGRERDPETGFQYHHARYYDPYTGRWTTEDPKGFAAGDSNLYRYVHNGYTLTTDPSGLHEVRRPVTHSIGPQFWERTAQYAYGKDIPRGTDVEVKFWQSKSKADWQKFIEDQLKFEALMKEIRKEEARLRQLAQAAESQARLLKLHGPYMLGGDPRPPIALKPEKSKEEPSGDMVIFRPGETNTLTSGPNMPDPLLGAVKELGKFAVDVVRGFGKAALHFLERPWSVVTGPLELGANLFADWWLDDAQTLRAIGNFFKQALKNPGEALGGALFGALIAKRLPAIRQEVTRRLEGLLERATGRRRGSGYLSTDDEVIQLIRSTPTHYAPTTGIGSWNNVNLRSCSYRDRFSGTYVDRRVALRDAQPGRYIYVVDEQGRMWLGPIDDAVKHNSLVPDGARVRAAGHIHIQSDRTVNLNSDSGHYMQEAPILGAEEARWMSAISRTIDEAGFRTGRLDPGVGLVP